MPTALPLDPDAATLERADIPKPDPLDPASKPLTFAEEVRQSADADEEERLKALEKPDPKTVKKEEVVEKPDPNSDPLDAISGKKPAEVKKEEVVADPLKEFDEVEKGIRSDKVRESFVSLRKIAATERDKAAAAQKIADELKQKLETGATNPEIEKRMKALEAENIQYKDAITALNVEYDPAYQVKYVQGEQKLIDRAAQRVADGGGDADAFKNAMKLTGKDQTAALRKALDDVDDIQKPRVMAVMEQIATLQDERAELRKDPQQSWEKLQRSREEVRRRQNQEADVLRKQTFDRVTRELSETVPLLSTVDPTVKGGAEWNEAVKGARERALTHFSPEAKPDAAMRVAIMGEDYVRVQNLLLEERKVTREQAKKIAEYEGTVPKPRGSRQPPPREKDGGIMDTSRGLGDILVEQANAGDGD